MNIFEENTHQVCVYLWYESLSQHKVMRREYVELVHILCIHFYKHEIANTTIY